MTELLSLWSELSSSNCSLHEQSNRFGNRRQLLSTISLILLLRLLLLLELLSSSGCCLSIGELRLILRPLPVNGKEILYFLCNVPSASIVKQAFTREQGVGAILLHFCAWFVSSIILCFHLECRIIDFHPRNDGNYPKLEQKRPETLSKHIFVEFR